MKFPTMPETLTHQELMELRDHSGLSRKEFYTQLFKQAEVTERVEVSGIRKEIL